MSQNLYYWDVNYPIPYPTGQTSKKPFLPLKIPAFNANDVLFYCETIYKLDITFINEIKKYEMTSRKGYTNYTFKLKQVFDVEMQQIKSNYHKHGRKQYL